MDLPIDIIAICQTHYSSSSTSQSFSSILLIFFINITKSLHVLRYLFTARKSCRKGPLAVLDKASSNGDLGVAVIMEIGQFRHLRDLFPMRRSCHLKALVLVHWFRQLKILAPRHYHLKSSILIRQFRQLRDLTPNGEDFHLEGYPIGRINSASLNLQLVAH